MGGVKLTPDDIVEELIDELAMGELGASEDAFELTRIAPGSLVLNYGDRGRFTLVVTEALPRLKTFIAPTGEEAR